MSRGGFWRWRWRCRPAEVPTPATSVATSAATSGSAKGKPGRPMSELERSGRTATSIASTIAFLYGPSSYASRLMFTSIKSFRIFRHPVGSGYGLAYLIPRLVLHQPSRSTYFIHYPRTFAVVPLKTPVPAPVLSRAVARFDAGDDEMPAQ